MTLIFLSIVVVLDLVLLGVIYTLYQRWQEHDRVLSDITEERQMIGITRTEIKEELDAAAARATTILTKIEKISVDIEQEIKHASDTIAVNLDSIVEDLSLKFEQPLQELSTRQQALTKLFGNIRKEKEVVSAVLARSERLLGLFDKALPYDEVVKDIEHKRYTDARKLLTRGGSIDQVSKELGIPMAEVRLINGLSCL